MTTATKELIIHRRSVKQHPHQAEFVLSKAKRIVVRAGRRGGKTVGAARKAVQKFLAGKSVERVVYVPGKIISFVTGTG